MAILMMLVSIPMFWGARNALLYETSKMMLAHYVTCKSNMASRMTAETSEWPYVCTYQLKFDDIGVYPYVFRGKECIKTI